MFDCEPERAVAKRLQLFRGRVDRALRTNAEHASTGDVKLHLFSHSLLLHGVCGEGSALAARDAAGLIFEVRREVTRPVAECASDQRNARQLGREYAAQVSAHDDPRRGRRADHEKIEERSVVHQEHRRRRLDVQQRLPRWPLARHVPQPDVRAEREQQPRTECADGD
eukprot:7212141-Prymnesium_polylepis.1